MSRNESLRFGLIAEPLFDHGYFPIPIRPGTKQPFLKAWQVPRKPDEWPGYCQSAGTGLLTAFNPAIDMDVRDCQTVAGLTELADGCLGVAPTRVGQPPKTLLLYQAEHEFPKLTSRSFALPGDAIDDDGWEPHRLEILAHGQQLVAYAVHPTTKKPYRWDRGEPLAVPRTELPLLDEAGARAFIRLAEEWLHEQGAIFIRWIGARWLHDDSALNDRIHRKVTPDYWFAYEPLEELIEILDSFPINLGVHKVKNGYRCRCPAHKGRSNTSLLLTEERVGIGFHCFCCPAHSVAEVLAFLMAEARSTADPGPMPDYDYGKHAGVGGEDLLSNDLLRHGDSSS